MSDTREVTASIDIAAPPAAVIDAFLDPNALAGWWGVERHLVDPRPGGVYALTWNISDQGFGFVSSGTVREFEPGHRLLIADMVYFNPERPILGPMTFEVNASPIDPNTTRLHIRQAGYQRGEAWDWYYEAVKDAWPRVLPLVKNYLESGE